MASPRRQIELPHLRSGEIDWRTLGNILTAHLLGEVLHASYVDYKYGLKNSDYQANTDWEFRYEENDVIVLRKRFSDSPIFEWMGRGVIDLPVQDVVAFLQNHSNRRYWDKYLSEVYVKKRLSDTDILLYLHLQATQCLIKQHRDFVYYERGAYVEGKFVRTNLSIDLPEYGPTQGITRAEILPGTGWVLQPYERNKTLVSYSVHTDMKNLPPLIINRATRRVPMAIYRIREFLTNPDYRSKVERAVLPGLKSEEDTTASQKEAEQEDILSSYTQPRFLAEQQLSVGDFLKNRVALRRNCSVPANLEAPRQYLDTRSEFTDGNTKRRSRSCGESVVREFDDVVDECYQLNPSQSPSTRHSKLTPRTHTEVSSEQANGETDLIELQTQLYSLSTEGKRKGSTPFLTPEDSSDEVSPDTCQYYTPLNSQDDMERDDEAPELFPPHSEGQAKGLSTQHLGGDDPVDVTEPHPSQLPTKSVQ